MVFASMKEKLLHLYEHNYQAKMQTLKHVVQPHQMGLLIMKFSFGKFSFDNWHVIGSSPYQGCIHPHILDAWFHS